MFKLVNKMWILENVLSTLLNLSNKALTVLKIFLLTTKPFTLAVDQNLLSLLQQNLESLKKIRETFWYNLRLTSVLPLISLRLKIIYFTENWLCSQLLWANWNSAPLKGSNQKWSSKYFFKKIREKPCVCLHSIL